MRAGDRIATLHVNAAHAAAVPDALALLAGATTIADTPPEAAPLVIERL